MKLFIIALLNQAGVRPVTRSFLEDGVEASHGAGCAPDIIRETGSCCYIDPPVRGLPERYRKAEAYIMIGNSSGIYMFGTDAKMLAEQWNQETAA